MFVSGVVLIGSTFRRGDSATDREAFADCISQRSAVTVTVLVQQAATVGVFTAHAAVFALILQREVQAIHQAEEVGVTVSGIAVTTLLHKVVSAVGVAAELRQNIGPGGHIIGYAVVTTIIEGTCVSEFQTRKRHTRPGVVAAFSLVALNLIFPLAITGQLIVNLRFAFEADTHVGLVAVAAFVVREVVQAINFTKQV